MLKYNIPTKKIPISRNGLFYSKQDFDYDVQVGLDYIQQDLGQSVILYQVDRTTTNVDSTYNESKKGAIRFKPPIEITCTYELFDAENKPLNAPRGVGFYKQLGKLEFYVYQETLDENEVDILYGDYVGLVIDEEHMEYFSVTDDGRKPYSNTNTMFGYKWFWRKISAAVVDKNEFEGI